MNKQSKANYSAFDTALYYLTFKNRTQKEIQDKLNEKGYSVSEVDTAISKLKEYGYINDENYALSYIKDNVRKKGGRLIAMELKNKGIASDVSKEIMDDCMLDMDAIEYETIKEIYEKRYLNSDLKDQMQRIRIVSYFQRRGFRYENISKVLSFFGKNGENS